MEKPSALRIILIASLGAGMMHAGVAMAEFSLNWTADTANPAFSGTSIVHGTTTTPGQSPFIYERVTDGGVNYYHLVVGDPNTGFAQETYIQIGTAAITIGFQGIGPQLSSSGGQILPTGNATDPLGTGAFAGNSTGNPNRVQMRQIVEDGDLSVDFLKDTFLEKPSITNTIESADLNATFQMNSAGNPYSSSATPSQVTNTVEHLAPDMPAASAVFDMAVDSQDSRVTAGRYTTTNPQPGAPGGAYTYVEGGANLNPDWSSFFDHREANPWSYPVNRPTPP